MSKRQIRAAQVFLLAVLLVILLRFPSYSLIVVQNEAGTTVIERTGPGVSTIHVEGPDGIVAESKTW